MKCTTLFSEKNRKNISLLIVCILIVYVLRFDKVIQTPVKYDMCRAMQKYFLGHMQTVQALISLCISTG